MYRTYQIKIKKGHRMYDYFDEMSFLSKNLYNTGNYFIKQCLTGLKKEDKDLTPNEREVITLVNDNIPKLNQLKENYHNRKGNQGKEVSKYRLLDKNNSFLSFGLLEGILKVTKNKDYTPLPIQVSQQILRLLMRDWKSFFKANKDYKVNPYKYTGRPKLPKYAEKKGRKVVIFTNQVCNIKNNKYLKFPKTKTQLNIGKLGLVEGRLKEVRAVPRHGFYIVEMVIEVKEDEKVKLERGNKLKEKSNKVIGIDLGIDNFATITNNIGLQPVIIKGKVIKSINRFYNKNKAHYYGILRQGNSQKEGLFTSKRLRGLDARRNAKVKDFMHKASRNVINYCLLHDIDTIIIGKNIDWKRNINIGKVNNQKFVMIPYELFISMLEYKASEKGIKLITTEESYTSKSSFLDFDNIPVYEKDSNKKHKFSGRRIKRGLYKTQKGHLINADVNASLNIILKVIPDAFRVRDIGMVNHPQMLSIS